jgi:predicted protein tyrosine phosphatase
MWTRSPSLCRPRICNLAGNRAEGPPKLLFICSRNKWRSRTAEELYRDVPGFVAKSAGTEPGSRQRVTEGLIGWADLIFVMEAKHRDYLRAKFPDALAGKRVICLRIPDDFTFNDPDLIDLLKANLSSYLPLL